MDNVRDAVRRVGWIGLAVAAVLVIGCGDGAVASPQGPAVTLTPPIASARPDGAGTSPTPIASADRGIVEPQGEGLTLTSDASGQADLEGGRYRVAWYAPDCDLLEIWWQVGSGQTVIPVELPSGEAFVDLPSGPGSLDRTASCPNGADYTIRFERAP